MSCSTQHVPWIAINEMVLWKFAIISESAFSFSLSLLSQGPCRGWIDDACMTWFQETVSLSSLYPPFILPLPPSLVPEILLAKDRSFLFTARGQTLWERNVMTYGYKKLLMGAETTKPLSISGQREGTLKKVWECKNKGRSRKNLGTLVMNIFYFTVLPTFSSHLWKVNISILKPADLPQDGKSAKETLGEAVNASED